MIKILSNRSALQKRTVYQVKSGYKLRTDFYSYDSMHRSIASELKHVDTLTDALNFVYYKDTTRKEKTTCNK